VKSTALSLLVIAACGGAPAQDPPTNAAPAATPPVELVASALRDPAQVPSDAIATCGVQQCATVEVALALAHAIDARIRELRP
jgi:hypothetical protein